MLRESNHYFILCTHDEKKYFKGWAGGLPVFVGNIEDAEQFTKSPGNLKLRIMLALKTNGENINLASKRINL